MPDPNASLGRINSPCVSGTLLPGIRSGQNLTAGGRQLCQRHRWPRLLRLGWGRRMKNGILDPIGEVVRAAAFASRLRRLALTIAAARRTCHTDVEVIIVAPPRPDLRKPAAVAPGLAA